MARIIPDLPNAEAPDSDYPYGRIKNNTGGNNGTPVNEFTNGDWHQFFARMMDIAGITPNGLPDNDYSGFQLFEALMVLTGSYKTTSTSSLLVGLGSKTFEVANENLSFQKGVRVRASSSANSDNFMEGTVTSYTSGDLIVNVDTIGGSGTLDDWNINLGSITCSTSNTLTMINGYSGTVTYRKDPLGNVYLYGVVSSPAVVTDPSFGVLPVGFRPPAPGRSFPVGYWGNSEDNVICFVEANGECRLYKNGTGGPVANVSASKSFDTAPVIFNVNS